MTKDKFIELALNEGIIEWLEQVWEKRPEQLKNSRLSEKQEEELYKMALKTTIKEHLLSNPLFNK